MNEQASDQKATWSVVEDLAVKWVFVVAFKFKLYITLGVRCVMIEPTVTQFCTPFTPSNIRALHDRYQEFKVARTWVSVGKYCQRVWQGLYEEQWNALEQPPPLLRDVKVASAIFSLWPLSICGSQEERGDVSLCTGPQIDRQTANARNHLLA